MLRLIGKQSNNSWYLSAFTLLVIVAASLEYSGIIQILPNDNLSSKSAQSQPRSR
jgi:hypothetical protein